MTYLVLVGLWLVVFGPLWLIGWGILRVSRTIHWLADKWCRFLLMAFPAP